MSFENPDQPQMLAAMNASTRASRIREELMRNLLHVTMGCPYGLDNPPFCPLHAVRELEPAARIQWVQNLTDEELEYLSNYHEICLHWRSASGGP